VDCDDENRDVFFVVADPVQIVNYSRSGRETAYASINPGGYLVELAAIDGQPRSATVVAADDCLLAAVPPQVFLTLLRDHPDLSIRVLQGLASIIRSCDDRIKDLSTLRAVKRVYLEFLRLAKPDAINPNSWVIHPMRTQVDAGTTREAVARVLAHLAEAGIIERTSKTLYIRDKPKLEMLDEVVNPDSDIGLLR
jgi:CRP-like cAMP-binding protein